jgi:hypothetical protein
MSERTDLDGLDPAAALEQAFDALSSAPAETIEPLSVTGWTERFAVTWTVAVVVRGDIKPPALQLRVYPAGRPENGRWYESVRFDGVQAAGGDGQWDIDDARLFESPDGKIAVFRR